MPFFTYQYKKVYYEVTGAGSKTILLLPGNTTASPSYTGEVDRLHSHYRLVLIDFLGTGQSDRYASDQYPGAAFWRSCAMQASFLLHQLDIPKVIAMGTSGGGLIALLMATMSPDQIRAVAADSCVDQWNPDDLLKMIRGRTEMLQQEQPFWQTMHGSDWRDVIAMDNHALLGLANSGGEMISSQELLNIHCPVLLTGSRTDDLVPHLEQAQIRMASSLAHCQHHLGDEGSHPWMWSRANNYQALLTEFLASLGRDQ